MAAVLIERPERVMIAARCAARRAGQVFGLQPADVEDICANILLLAVDRARLGYPPGRRAIRLCARTATAKVLRRREVVTEHEQLVERGPVTDGPERVSIALHQLQRAWPALTGFERACVLLRIEGLSADEAAEQLGRDADSIAATLHRARGKIEGDVVLTGVSDENKRRGETPCAGCGGALPTLVGRRPGRARRYCGGACKQAAYRAARGGKS